MCGTKFSIELKYQKIKEQYKVFENYPANTNLGTCFQNQFSNIFSKILSQFSRKICVKMNRVVVSHFFLSLFCDTAAKSVFVRQSRTYKCSCGTAATENAKINFDTTPIIPESIE